jgi:hypothetical protein
MEMRQYVGILVLELLKESSRFSYHGVFVDKIKCQLHNGRSWEVLFPSFANLHCRTNTRVCSVEPHEKGLATSLL